MKLGLWMVTIGLLVMLAAATGWAYPTRFGPVTGLVDLPTADTAASGQAEIAGDYSKLENGGKIWPLRVVVGVSESAELGIGYARFANGGSEDATSFGAKVALMQETATAPGLAVGGSSFNGATSDVLDIYAVISKEIPMAEETAYRTQEPRARMRGHAGVAYTRVQNGSDDDEVKPFVGLDLTTPEGASFVAEYKWTKFGDNQAAAAIRYPVTPTLGVQVGVARAGTVMGEDEFRFFAGFNYMFGVTRESATPF